MLVFARENIFEYSELCNICQVMVVKVFIVQAYKFDLISIIEDKSCLTNKLILEKRLLLNKKVTLKIV